MQRPFDLVAFAGLPGTGKTTLARLLADALGAPLFSKDSLRAALFAPRAIEFSREQDDLCVRLLLEAVLWTRDRGPAREALLDGRTWTRPGDAQGLERFASEHGLRLSWIECRARMETALSRLAKDRAQGLHPAANRDERLYQELARRPPLALRPVLALETDALDLNQARERMLAFVRRD